VTVLKYPRVMLKLSGEALAGEKGGGFDFDVIEALAGSVHGRARAEGGNGLLGREVVTPLGRQAVDVAADVHA